MLPERHRVGGISLNYAVHARRAGADHVALVSCIGSDAAADDVLAALARERVDASHVSRRTGRTASQRIVLRPGGERVFPPGGYDPGVLTEFRLHETALAFIGTFDAVSVPWFRQIVHLSQPALRAAAPGAMRIADLLDGEDLGANLAGIDEVLRDVDLAFLSGDRSLIEVIEPHAARSRALIVVTHGAAGSTACANGEMFSEPAVVVPPHECVDSTGCGDAFQAAFTVHWLHHRDVRGALRAGAAQAAQVIRHLGAIGGDDA